MKPVGFPLASSFFDGSIVIDIEYLDSRTLCNIWWLRKILEKFRFCVDKVEKWCIVRA